MDGHQSTLDVAGPVARTQRDLFYVTCGVTFVIFILVGSVLAYATLKFKARNDADEHAEEEGVVDDGLVEVEDLGGVCGEDGGEGGGDAGVVGAGDVEEEDGLGGGGLGHGGGDCRE